MTRPRVATISAAAIAAAYVAVAAAMAVVPDAMATGTPGLPGFPLVVTLHAALFVAIVAATITVTRRLGE